MICRKVHINGMEIIGYEQISFHMKKWTLYILFLMIILNACKSIKNNFVDQCIDYELEVYQSIIDSIKFINTFKPFRPSGMPLSLKEKKRFDSELADYNSKMDTLKKYLFISDTFKIYNDQHEYGDSIGYFKQIENCSNMIEQLCDSIDNFSLIPVDIKIIDIDFYDKFGFKEDGLYVGALSLSKILFNDDYTEGCLSYSFVCGGKCAVDMLLIVEKCGNKWKIKKEIILGVS